jgi:hypothetical protein
MQAAKDTFLKTLAARLATVNAARTIVMDGCARAAVIDESDETALPPAGSDCFVLSWGEAGYAAMNSTLMYLDCTLSYASKGTDAMLRTDRGRTVGAMCGELLQICQPRIAAKMDYTNSTPKALGTQMFWTLPVMGAEKDSSGVLTRTAKLRIFFFPEVSQ